jgi:hypothetical protein
MLPVEARLATLVETLALGQGDALELAFTPNVVSKAAKTASMPKNARPAALEVSTFCSMT